MRYDTALAVRRQGWSKPTVNSRIEWIERNQSMIAIQGACGSLASLNVIGIRQWGRKAGKRLGCHSGAVFSFKQFVGYGLRHAFRPDFSHQREYFCLSACSKKVRKGWEDQLSLTNSPMWQLSPSSILLSSTNFRTSFRSRNFAASSWSCTSFLHGS